MIEHAPELALAATPRVRSRGFLASLALVTFVPLIGVPLAIATSSGGGLLFGSFGLLAITGPMHVASTAFFYFDRVFAPVIAESRPKCVWSLAWLPATIALVGLAGAAVIGPWAYLAIFTFHNVWLFYHYQRQNFGLASFVSTHVGCGRLPARVNTALNVAALGAIVCLLGSAGFLPQGGELVPASVTVGLRWAGTAVYAAAIVMMLTVFRAEPRLRASASVAAALVFGLAFFLPTIVFRSAAMAFLPVALAHGAQYILMMSVVSGRSARGLLAFVTMCAVGVGAGLGLKAMTDAGWPAILVATGLVQVHFLVDAKVWRLREPRQRAIMNDRFDFLLAA